MDADNVEIDPIHNEVFVVQRSADAILVFPREANGDVAPIRIIQGPKTGLRYPRRLTVDPANNLLAVISEQGIVLFNRNDNGDVAPRCVISGPKTGLPNLAKASNSKAMLNPDAQKIIFAVRKPAQTKQEVERSGGGMTLIWKYGDCGDVPPLYRFEEGAPGFDLIPEAKEIIIDGKGGLMVFSLPEAF